MTTRIKKPGKEAYNGSEHQTKAARAYYFYLEQNGDRGHSAVYIATPHPAGGYFEALFRPNNGMPNKHYYDEIYRNAEGLPSMGTRNIEIEYRSDDRWSIGSYDDGEPDPSVFLQPIGPLGNPIVPQMSGVRRQKSRSRSRRSRRRYQM